MSYRTPATIPDGADLYKTRNVPNGNTWEWLDANGDWQLFDFGSPKERTGYVIARKREVVYPDPLDYHTSFMRKGVKHYVLPLGWMNARADLNEWVRVGLNSSTGEASETSLAMLLARPHVDMNTPIIVKRRA